MEDSLGGCAGSLVYGDADAKEMRFAEMPIERGWGLVRWIFLK